ncbi:MAG: glycosyltransferase, partial [Candidatus Rokuibacteriota bacterium]
MSLRVAMLSVHTCPLAALGGKETGGMNVYVRELARELGRMGVEVDVFTRSQNRDIPRVVALGDRARVIHLAAGPEAPIARETIHNHLDQFADGVEAWRRTRDVDYDLIHAHYWLSGEVALRLRARRSTPVVAMFHTLGRLKNRVAATDPDREPDVRIAGETRVIAEADRLVAANVVERRHLVEHYDADPARIAVIPCGVDTDLFRPGDRAAARRALGVGVEPLLLYVGRLTPIKGLDTLLTALACLRTRNAGARLLIVGGDADEAETDATSPLARRAAELGLA